MRGRAVAPIDRTDVGWFFGAYALLVVLWYALGRAIIASDAVMQADTEASQWWAERRTPRLGRLTQIGSALSGTGIKILATAVLAGWMLTACRRWPDRVPSRTEASKAVELPPAHEWLRRDLEWASRG